MRSPYTAAAPVPPVTPWLLPPRTRRHLAAMSSYADLLRDLAHTPATYPDDLDRAGALDTLEADLSALYAGSMARHPVLRELAPAIRTFGLPAEPLRRMIDAARDEQLVRQYGTFAQLVEHCHREADPLGELTLYVLGAPSPERITLSDWICTGTRLAEHIATVREDWRHGRCYLPKEDLDRFEVAPADLGRRVTSDRLRALVALHAERARAFLESGAPLVSTLSGRPRLAVSGHLARLRAMLTGLERRGYDPPEGRPTAGATAALWQWLRAPVRTAG